MVKTDQTSERRSWRKLSRDIIDDKRFEVASLTLVTFSLATFVVETIPSLESLYSKELDFLETIIILLFTLEYFLRLSAAPLADGQKDKDNGGPGGKAYATSVLGIVDLLTILPFWLAVFGVDGRPIRTFRLVRLLRLLKLALRFKNALERIKIGWKLGREELVYALLGAMAVIFVSSVFIYFFESRAQPDAFGSVPEALWWAAATFTTIGYGDITPITDGGKAFSFLLLLTALVMLGVPAGIIASALGMARETQAARRWEKTYEKEIGDEEKRLEQILKEVNEAMENGDWPSAKKKLRRLKWNPILINPYRDALKEQEAEKEQKARKEKKAVKEQNQGAQMLPEHRWLGKTHELRTRINTKLMGLQASSENAAD